MIEGRARAGSRLRGVAEQRASVAALMWAMASISGACSDGESAPADAAVDAAEVMFPDTAFPDTTVPDTIVPDTIVPDTTAPDTTVPDTTVPDTTPADTTTPDTTPADTTPPDTSPTDTAPADTADTAPTDTGPGPTCLTLSPTHRRHVVVARPYAEPDGAQSPRWQVLPLGDDGALGKVASDFTMGRAHSGRVAFRADGALGVSHHDDGTIGVFALDESGRATVIEPSLDPGAYVDEVHVMGDHLLLVDGNWAENGGGIYRAELACDGSVGPAVRLYPTKLAASLHLDGPRHLVAAKEAVTTTHGTLHLVAPSGSAWTRVSGTDLFDGEDDILSALAITHDGRFALVGDNSFFSGVDNRVGVAALGEGTLTAVDVLTPLLDPMAIVASPHDDAILVVSGYGDAVRVLSYDRDRDPPFIDMGEPDYVTSPPALPADAVLVGGAFLDLVLVVENQAIRRFRFDGDGGVTDLGPTAIGDSYDAIPGAIGVQP